MLLGFQKEDVVLTLNLFKMMLRDRYLGSSLGLLWAVLTPFLLLATYTFVFGFIFRIKLPGSDSTLTYVIWLISGLVPFFTIADGLSLTAGSVISGSNLIKNIVFKSETLVLAATLTAMVPFGIGMLFLFSLLIIAGNYPSWHVFALLPFMIIHLLFLLGLGFFVAATAVFLRDIVQAIPTLTLFVLFFSPIFYTREQLPKTIAKITFFNPFYRICQPYRDMLLSHRMPDMTGIGYLFCLSCVLLLFGLKYYRHLKGYFESRL